MIEPHEPKVVVRFALEPKSGWYVGHVLWRGKERKRQEQWQRRHPVLSTLLLQAAEIVNLIEEGGL